jgi:ketosteroid isomerase-like protein
MSPTLHCGACGARWHTAARRGRTEATETCLRCGGRLDEELAGPEALVTAIIAQWDRGDVEALLALCHPDIEIREIPELVPGGEPSFAGRDGARRWIELMAEAWDLEFRVERRETKVVDRQTAELVNELEARSSKGHPDYFAVTRSLWRFDGGLLRSVEFSGERAPAPDARRA